MVFLGRRIHSYFDTIGNDTPTNMEGTPDTSEQERFDELKERMSKAYGRAVRDLSILKRIEDFMGDLRERHDETDLLATRLYHLISIGSTSLEPTTQFDLPDGSIERFIREEL